MCKNLLPTADEDEVVGERGGAIELDHVVKNAIPMCERYHERGLKKKNASPDIGAVTDPVELSFMQDRIGTNVDGENGAK